MTRCKNILFAVAATSLAVPAASAAQDYYVQPDYLNSSEPRDFDGYVEFRGIKMGILRKIDQALREDRITPGKAQDFLDELGTIQDGEVRDFRFYGWRPSVSVRQEIRYALNHLSREIDDEAGY